MRLAHGALTRDGGVGGHHIGAHGEIDFLAPVADNAVAAVGAHLDVVGRAGVQARERVLVGGGVVGVSIQINQGDIPGSRAVVGPGDRRAAVGDIGHDDVLGHRADGRHKDVVHIPDSVRRRGVVSEGDGRAGGGAGEGHNLPDISVGSPIVVAVGADGREGRGIGNVGEVTHLEGAVTAEDVVLRTQPEHHLQTVSFLCELWQGDQVGGTLEEGQRIFTASGVVVGRCGDMVTHHIAGNRTPAVVRILRLKVVSVRHCLRVARCGREGFNIAPAAQAVGAAVILCHQLVGTVGMQTRQRVGRSDARHLRPFAAGLAVAQVAGVAGGPGHRRPVGGDIGDRHIVGRDTSQRGNHHGCAVGRGIASRGTNILNLHPVLVVRQQSGNRVRRYLIGRVVPNIRSVHSSVTHVVGQAGSPAYRDAVGCDSHHLQVGRHTARLRGEAHRSAPGAHAVGAAVGHRLHLVGRVGLQAGNRVRRGNRLFADFHPAAAGGAVAQQVVASRGPAYRGTRGTHGNRRQVGRCGTRLRSGEAHGVAPIAVHTVAAVGTHRHSVCRLGRETVHREGIVRDLHGMGLVAVHHHIPDHRTAVLRPAQFSRMVGHVADSKARRGRTEGCLRGETHRGTRAAVDVVVTGGLDAHIVSGSGIKTAQCPVSGDGPFDVESGEAGIGAVLDVPLIVGANRSPADFG